MELKKRSAVVTYSLQQYVCKTVVIKNPKPCKICGVIGHSATFCRFRRNKPIARRTRIKSIGKVTTKWLRYRAEWFETHPPDDKGFYYCYYCKAIGVTEGLTRREATLDHWHSRTRKPGLRFEDSNIVVACYRHNKDKGSRSGDEYLEIIKG
jgi:5-methylcytosine-specific restriction endonuclease McrA